MENYLTIGEVSKITRLPISKLRYFDSEGILSPYYKDENTNYRYYKLYQIPILKMIVHLKNLGFNNASIKSHLKNLNYSHTLELIEEMKKKTDKEIERLKLLKEKLVENEIQIKYLRELEQEIDTFFIKEEAIDGIYCELSNENIYQSMSEASKELDSFLFEKNEEFVPVGICAFVITQKSIEEKTYEYDKFLVLKKYEDYPRRYILPMKKYICLVCIGELSGVETNINRTLDWMRDNGYELDGDTIINIISGATFRKNPFEAMYILKMPIKKIKNWGCCKFNSHMF